MSTQMYRGTRLWLALLVGVSFAIFSHGPVQVQAASPNLLQNPGFESGTNSWYQFGSSAGSATTGNAHSGSNALQLGTGEAGLAQNVTLQPNTVYALSAWGKTSGTSDFAQVTLRVTDNNGTQYEFRTSFAASDYNRAARTITTPASVASALVYVLKSAGSGYFYADDISLAAGRDPQAWPFASDSIWNTPIGANAQRVPAGFLSAQQFKGDVDYLSVADSTSPLRAAYRPGGGNITGNDFGVCLGDVYQGDMQLPDSFVLPDGTRNPYSTPNKAGAVLQPDGRTLIQFQPLTRCNAGGPVYGYRSTDQDIYGPGIYGPHYGSGLSSIGGALRLGELVNNGPIRHALQLEFNMGQYAYYSSSRPGFRWPAERADNGAATGYCSQQPCLSNPNQSLVQGSLLALPASATEASLGITTAAGRKLFQALQDYGGYVVDDTLQGDVFAIGIEAGAQEEFFSSYGYAFDTDYPGTGAWFNDLNAMFQALQVIDNNSPTNIGGGGTRRAALAPDFVNTPPAAPQALSRTGWTASASLNSGSASAVLDGNTSTSWRSGQSQATGHNVIVNMGSPRSFNRVAFDTDGFPREYPQDYQVFISNDGTNWGTQIAGGSGSVASIISFPTKTAQYIKLQLLGGSITSQAWSISELNVYAAGTTQPSGSTLVNPGFEQGGTGWTFTGASGTATNYPRSGSSQAWLDSGSTNQIAQTITVGSAGTYTLSAWTAAGGGGGVLGVRVNGTNRASVAISNNGSYTQQQLTGITLSANDSVQVYVTGGASWVNVDDFSFVQSSSAGQNVLTDAGFEQSGTGWTFTGASGTATNYPRAGNRQAWLNAGNTNQIAQTVTIGSAGTYTLSAWTAAGGGGGVLLIRVNGTNRASVAIPNNGSYSQQQITGIALNANDSVQVYIAGGTSWVNVDDVSLSQ